MLDVRILLLLLEPDGRLDGRWGTLGGRASSSVMVMMTMVLVVAGQRLDRRRVGVGVAGGRCTMQPILAAAAPATAAILKEGRQVLARMRTEIVGTPSRCGWPVIRRITTGLFLGNVGRGLERCTSSGAGGGAAILLVGCAVGVIVRIHRCGVVVAAR